MTENDLALLKASIDRELILEFNDGATERVLILVVSDEDHDVIYDFVPKKEWAALTPWDEISSVRKVPIADGQ